MLQFRSPPSRRRLQSWSRDHQVLQDQQAPSGNQARKERRDRMDQQAKWGLLGLLGCLGLSALVAVTVGKVIKAYQEPPASKVGPAKSDLRVIRDRPGVTDPWVQQGRMGPSDQWGLPVNPARPGPWDQWDL